MNLELNKLINTNCNALHLYARKCRVAFNTKCEGVELVTQDKNQIKNFDEQSSETQQDGFDLDKITRPSEETGGPSGPEPTRYGDWERKGRCIDF